MVNLGISEADVWKALAQIKDPEIPVLSIVDLKIVHSVEVANEKVHVELTPTFVGCPALETMVEQVRGTLHALGFLDVTVKKSFVVPWSTDLLEEDARRRLEHYGVAPPVQTANVLREDPVVCPFCQSSDTRIEGRFGATLCKQLCYCNACKQSFERFRTI